MTTRDQCHYDVVIIGGGLVGASLACALSGHGLTVGVIEAVSPRAESQPSYDDRTLALALASVRIFSAIGVWPELVERGTPIHQVHVSSLGQLGMLKITAAEMDVDALGYIAEAREVGRALYARLAELPDCEVHCPARVTGLRDESSGAVIEVEESDGDKEIVGQLIVAADGAYSIIRDLRNIDFGVRDYEQTAVIANITPEAFHDYRAFERFTPSGQLAILPHVGRRCGLVWVLPHDEADHWLKTDDDAFLAEVQRRFGYRLGHFGKLGKRASYPLRLGYPQTDIAARTILIGNAAHTIHPVAAQGFNLGLRDAALLAEHVVAASRSGADLGDADMCRSYSDSRRADQREMMAFTDGLVRIFTHPSGLVRAGRSLGLLGMALSPAARRAVARRTMGYAGKVPRLAQALAL